MQPIATVGRGGVTCQGLAAGPGIPLLARFLGKLVLDIMPAALASVIGGFLFTQYQYGHAVPPHLATEQVTPASAEMMAMVRDEHTMMMDYLKTQMAAEKSKMAAEDAATARAEADAKATDSKALEAKADTETKAVEAAPVHRAAPVLAALKSPARAKPVPVAVAWHAPLVIAQAEPDAPQGAPPPSDRLASDPNSLLAKTLDLKDHVVAATRHVVSAIGDMFASVGERLTGSGDGAARQQFSSAS